jgi:CBS domain-containing protein
MESVADILNEKGHEVWTVTGGVSVGAAVELMADKNIGAVVVVGDDGKPVGIVSERDVARGLLRTGSHLADATVDEIMSPQVKCVRETLSIAEAMAVMTHNRFRHLPVCREGTLAGLVSIGEVVKAQIHEQEFVIDQLEHYIAGSL